MKKVALVCVGSFNPVTFMHLRMFVLAKDYLYNKLQWNVIGGIISPVHDDYKKKNLATARQRCRMVELALEEHNLPWLKSSKWETEQKTWSRTIETLEYHQVVCNGGQTDNEITTKIAKDARELETDEHVQVMLLCGSDVIESFTVPGLWKEEHLDTICKKFGIVCIAREGSNIEEILRHSNLTRYAEDIVVVPEWFKNQVSSTAVREAVRQGQCIGMIVPMNVAEFIEEERIYLEDPNLDPDKKKPLAFVYKSIRSPDSEDAYNRALTNAGWRTALIPVLNFQDRGVPELQEALMRPDSYSGLILTTPRAVDALAIAERTLEGDWKANLAKWNQKPVYAIGEGTAAEARNVGLTNIMGENSGNEAALAEVIKANKSKHQIKLLFPCGNLRLETLRVALLEHDIPVEFLECYETTAHPNLVALVRDQIATLGFPDVNVFFSPSGVQFMDQILRAESIAFKQTKYVAIGPTTAKALESAGYHVSAVAEHPNPERVVAALKKFQ
ncbi:hypothetical protein RvY_04610 [Ramazzottius varieornatus]|uniref:Nicotinamide/nicotinic acid mononucleotide adenylyltransferase 3 n=1 Tax=Ramazzottius varieornatus TaxID=947166 RepID=A0A1D1USU4_RAMVA|nr:hypothetical protein RvY_04610 [Ramazzottius varieornatus]